MIVLLTRVKITKKIRHAMTATSLVIVVLMESDPNLLVGLFFVCSISEIMTL